MFDGELVRVTSRRGQVVAAAKITSRSPVGTVFMTFHFAEAAANLLTTVQLDKRAKIPDYKNTAVRIQKSSAPEGWDEGYEQPLFKRGAIKDPVQIH